MMHEGEEEMENKREEMKNERRKIENTRRKMENIKVCGGKKRDEKEVKMDEWSGRENIE